MVLLNLGSGTGSDPARPQVVPMAQYVSGMRYTGLSALYMNPAWQSPNANESLLAQARARQAEALRKAQEAQAALASQPKPFTVDPFIADPENPQTPIPLEQAASGVLPYRTPGPWAAGEAPSEKLALQRAAINTPPSMRVDTQGVNRGPERKGFDQEKVWAANKLVGWRYVANGEVTEEQAAALRDEWTADAQRLNYVHDGMRYNGVSDVADRHYTRDQLTEADRMGLEGSADPYTWGPYVTEAQTQAYGTPTWVQDTEGRMIPQFNVGDPTQSGTDGGQKYIGIDPEVQKSGWVHINMPGPAPGPGASLEEQKAYREAVRQSITPPQYKVGDQMVVAANMGPSQRLDFQKQLRAAGLYEPGDVVHKGVLGAKELALLHDLMGEANQTGLTVKQVLADYTEKHNRVLAESRGGGGGGGGGGGITQQTTIQYNPTSIAAGRSMLAGILEQALGRAPSDTELSEYMAMLNAAENKSPVKTVTNYVKSGSSQTSTSRTTPSEVDPAAMAREFAAKIGGGDEMFAYQATSYLDKLMQSLIGAQNV